MQCGITKDWWVDDLSQIWVTKKDFTTNELKHWKYLKVIDVMVIPLCPKTPADPILGTHNGACGYACLHGIACHTTISIIWHIKKVLNHVKWGVELKMSWLNWSIPISSGFQFQFKIFQFNSCWIELNWLSIHELIRALAISDFTEICICRNGHYIIMAYILIICLSKNVEVDTKRLHYKLWLIVSGISQWETSLQCR